MSYFLLQIISSVIVTFGFAIIFNIKGRLIIYPCVAGMLSWIIFSIFINNNFSYGITYFSSALVLSIYAEIISRYKNIIATQILIPALIPLAPGGGIYYTIYNVIDKNYSLALSYGVDTMIIAGSMAIGVFTAPVIFKFIDDIKKIKKDS